MVTGNRSEIASATGWLVRIERPRSPLSARVSQVAYWTGNGRSSPSCARRRSLASGVASSPSIVMTGSPGVRWISEKMTMLTSSSTGTIETIRLRMIGRHFWSQTFQSRIMPSGTWTNPWTFWLITLTSGRCWLKTIGESSRIRTFAWL